MKLHPLARQSGRKNLRAAHTITKSFLNSIASKSPTTETTTGSISMDDPSSSSLTGISDKDMPVDNDSNPAASFSPLSTAETSSSNTVAASSSDATLENNTANRNRLFSTTTAATKANQGLAYRPKKPSPTLNGSPIKKSRALSTGATNSKKKLPARSPALDLSANGHLRQFINLPSYNPEGLNNAPYQPLAHERTTHDFAASNLMISDDPLDENCPVDLANLDVDANGHIVCKDPFLAQTPSNYSSIKTHMRWLNADPGVFKGPNWFRFVSKCQQPVHYIHTKTHTNVDQYHELADEYIESLVDGLEEMEMLHEEIDLEYSNGVINFHYPPYGTWVINKQPANKQIWLSSPISGPKRFDYREVITEDSDGNSVTGGKWVCEKDGERVSLSALLEREMEQPLHLHGEGREYNPHRQTWRPKGVYENWENMNGYGRTD